MYCFSVAAALTAAAVLRRTVFRGPRPTMMLELPPYRRPVASVLLRGTWQHVRSFLEEAGTVILALTIVLWALLYFPRDPQLAARMTQRTRVADATPADARRLRSPRSTRARRASACGTASPAGSATRSSRSIAPLGFDWKIGIGIVGAFAAREVFVSTHGHRVRRRATPTSGTNRCAMRLQAARDARTARRLIHAADRRSR